MKIKLQNQADIYKWFDLLFIFITVFYLFFYQIEKRVPYGMFIGSIFVAVIILSQLFRNRRKILTLDVLLYMIAGAVVLIDILLHNNAYLLETATNFLFLTVTFFFAGLIVNFEEYENAIYHISILYLLLNIYFLFTTFARKSNMGTDGLDHMALAYQGLFSVLFILYRAFKTKKLISICLSILGAIFLIMCGTRGPIICLVVCTVLFLLKWSDGNKKIALYSITGSLIIIPIVINIKNIALNLYPLFAKYHVSTRILTYMISDTSIREGSGRELIYSTVINSINAHPALGNGLMSDRLILNGSWSHNLMLEILNSFGYIIGLPLIVILICLVFKTGKICFRDERFYIFSILLSCSIIKLLMSSSFIDEKFLFLFIGYCIRVLRINKA